MICSGVPQPCEGRCWNKPRESRSPWSRLRSADSCIAVASAMVTARSGSPLEIPTAAIVAALEACSGVISYDWTVPAEAEPAPVAVAVQ